VKGALHIAELESLADTPATDDRKKKVVGDTAKVRTVLLTAPVNGMKLAVVLEAALEAATAG